MDMENQTIIPLDGKFNTKEFGLMTRFNFYSFSPYFGQLAAGILCNTIM